MSVNEALDEKIYDHRVLTHWSNVNNDTNGTVHYSIDMIFNNGHKLSIIGYSILFILSTIGNTTVLYLLIKRRLANRRHPLRIDIMLMHLAIADLFVTFLLMPLEVIWSYTVEWRSTDFICRLMSFFRVFGLYLSGFVLICISIDRYFAIVKPLKMNVNRGRIMLAIAWCMSILCSLPQALTFHLGEHPRFKGYYQCVIFDAFSNELQLIFYNMSTMFAMYACPLITFIYCYGTIYMKIYHASKCSINGVDNFRRSNDDVLCRAKKRTLKMTITIVIVFIICWTPYYFICMWYWFDYNTARKFSPLMRKGLYLFACTNSCMNPIVYGIFNIRGHINDNLNATKKYRQNTFYPNGRKFQEENERTQLGSMRPCIKAFKTSNILSKNQSPTKENHFPIICTYINCDDSIELGNLSNDTKNNMP